MMGLDKHNFMWLPLKIVVLVCFTSCHSARFSSLPSSVCPFVCVYVPEFDFMVCLCAVPAKPSDAVSAGSVLQKAMTTVVESLRKAPEDVRRRAGLTVQDVFYSEISRINQLFTTLAADVQARHAEPTGALDFTACANAVLLEVLKQVFAFRRSESNGKVYEAAAPVPGAEVRAFGRGR